MPSDIKNYKNMHELKKLKEDIECSLIGSPEMCSSRSLVNLKYF